MSIASSQASCRLQARFVLAGNGEPEYIESGGLRHYKIILNVRCEGSQPSVVTYFLHESYIDPIREVFHPDQDFAEPITSFGDFILRASLRGQQGMTTLEDSLSRLLVYSHADIASEAVREAIDWIRDH
jgi:hypothetical protein